MIMFLQNLAIVMMITHHLEDVISTTQTATVLVIEDKVMEEVVM
jgi:ABC-type uncharacterized transport system ATPase subunit